MNMKNKKNIKKFVNLLILLIIVVFGVLIIKSTLTQKPLQVEAFELKSQYISDKFVEQGIVKQGENFNILSDVSGEIIEVYVDENTYIEKGSTLAKINTVEYEYQKMIHQNNISSYNTKINEVLNLKTNEKKNNSFTIEELNQKLKSLEIQKKSAEINKEQKSAEIDSGINKAITYAPEEKINLLELSVEIAQKEYDFSKKNFDNVKTLYDIGSASKEQMDISENTFKKSESELEKAKSELDLNKKELEKLKIEGKSGNELNEIFYKYQNDDLETSINSIKVQIENLKYNIDSNNPNDTVDYYNSLIKNENLLIEQLDNKINKCLIKSNVSGYITQLPIKNKSIVQSGDLLGLIKMKDNYTVEVDVLTDNVSYLNIGEEVNIIQSLKNEDIIYKGIIKKIYNFAFEKMSALGLEERRVKIIAEITDENTKLKDGYNVNVEFEIYKEDNQLALPNSAVFKNNNENFVFKIEDEKAVLTKIDLKHKTNEKTVISEGLKEGDKVVYNANTENLTDGTLVLVKTKD